MILNRITSVELKVSYRSMLIRTVPTNRNRIILQSMRSSEEKPTALTITLRNFSVQSLQFLIERGFRRRVIQCDNRKGIFMLPVIAKILPKIILECAKKHLVTLVEREQLGFHLEFSYTADHSIFFDFEKESNSVSRSISEML